MKKALLIIILLSLVVLLTSCSKERLVTFNCQSPYLLVGTECCMDANQNNVCDKDENCNNGLKDQDETDVDCGGSHCNNCELNKACGVNSDCKMTYCQSGVCVGESCGNSVCANGENKCSCPGDCGSCSGNAGNGLEYYCSNSQCLTRQIIQVVEGRVISNDPIVIDIPEISVFFPEQADMKIDSISTNADGSYVWRINSTRLNEYNDIMREKTQQEDYKQQPNIKMSIFFNKDIEQFGYNYNCTNIMDSNNQLKESWDTRMGRFYFISKDNKLQTTSFMFGSVTQSNGELLRITDSYVYTIPSARAGSKELSILFGFLALPEYNFRIRCDLLVHSTHYVQNAGYTVEGKKTLFVEYTA